MASFFRKQIADKVSRILKRATNVNIPLQNAAALIKVNRHKCYQPQLCLPWKVVNDACVQADVNICPEDLLRYLRNQGLPTAEGIIDIKLAESPVFCLVFTVDKHIFSKIVLLDICTNEENLAKSSCLFENIPKGTVVLVKKFPLLGHHFNLIDFRAAIHTNFLANINKFAGHQVVKVAHVKDWGITAAAFLKEYENLKNEKKLLRSSPSLLLSVMKSSQLRYSNDFKFKEEADYCYQQMESGESKLISEWQDLKNETLKYYISIYKKIGLEFDYFHFDSCYREEIRSTFDNLVKRDIISKYKEEIQLEIEEDINESRAVNYIEPVLYELSRSLFAVHHIKKLHDFNKLFFVNSSHKQYYALLIETLGKMNETWSQNVHVVNLKTITDFESKKKIDIEEVLDKATEGMMHKLENLQLEASEDLKEMAEVLGLSSLYITDMKHRKNVNYKFLWKDVFNFGKDSAASFQFCYAGLKGLQKDSEYIFKYDMDTSSLLEHEAHRLVNHLARFDEMVYKSYSVCEPCILFQYLCSLWYFINMCSNVLKLDIKESRLRAIKSRLLLLSASLKILKNGLNLMGIKTMEKTATVRPLMEECK